MLKDVIWRVAEFGLNGVTMPSPTNLSMSDRRSAFGRRTIALLLALGVEALVVLALLWLSAPELRRREDTPEPTTFQILPEAKVAAKPTPEKRPKTKVKQTSRAAPRQPKPVALPPTPVPAKMIEVSSAEFAATDIAKLPSRSDDRKSGDDTGADSDSVAAYGPGEGPGGERLYNAEWVREPSDAEIAGYLPTGLTGGAALIACRTVAKNRVENCRSLGESPPGSGLARALRLASWQFLIRPPRVGGKPVVGAWVRIRFDVLTGVRK